MFIVGAAVAVFVQVFERRELRAAVWNQQHDMHLPAWRFGPHLYEPIPDTLWPPEDLFNAQTRMNLQSGQTLQLNCSESISSRFSPWGKYHKF